MPNLPERAAQSAIDSIEFVETGAPDCNWGELTSEAIAGGFDQGGHSSDPSGDGHGPGTLDEPRVGLANVVDQGDLHATCELIESLF